MLADTFVVMVNFLDGMSIHDGLFHLSSIRNGRHVVDATTLLAEEMPVGLGHCIVAGITFVDGECCGCTMVTQELEGVVDRRLRERGDTLGQGLIYLIHRRVGVMFHQVAHDGNALERWLDVVLLQTIDYIHRYINFQFVIIAFLIHLQR